MVFLDDQPDLATWDKVQVMMDEVRGGEKTRVTVAGVCTLPIFVLGTARIVLFFPSGAEGHAVSADTCQGCG